MLRHIPRVLRVCLALTVLGGGLILATAGTAGATETTTPSWTQTFDIQFGDKGVQIGTGTVSRYDGTDEDMIVVEYEIPGGYEESHLCRSSTAFTEKVEPGQCQYKNLDPAGESGSYSFTVEPDEVVYLQLHIAAQGETAYLGWVNGSPAYGNVEVPNVLTCPTGYEAPEGEMLDTTGDGVADNCEFIPVKADCPGDLVAPEGEDAMDTDGDGVADDCVKANVVLTCPAGYEAPEGEMLDRTGDGVADNCDFIPVKADCPEGLVAPEGEDAMDTDGDGDADNCVKAKVVETCPDGDVMVDGDCETPIVTTVPVVRPDTCPDGTTMTDVNRDGVANQDDCTAVLPDARTPTLPVPASPAEPATPEAPAVPAEPVPSEPVPSEPVLSVLPDAATPTVIPVAAAAPAVAETAVLGAQVQRAPLARTGSSSTGLAAFGALLVLLGASASVAGRRTARS